MLARRRSSSCATFHRLRTSFVYDAGGNRVVKVVDDGTDTFGTVYIDGSYEYTTTPTPQLQADPSSVSLTATEGGSVVSDDVSITTSDSSVASFTVSDDQTWLSASPSSGDSPATLTITADPTGQTPGTYNGTVTVTAPAYTDAVIPVAFTVNAAGGGEITPIQSAENSEWTGSTVIASLLAAPTVGNHMIAVVGSGAGLTTHRRVGTP